MQTAGGLSVQKGYEIAHEKASKRMARRQLVGQLLTHLYMLPIALVALFPLYWLVSTSFKWGGHILEFPPQWFPNPITIENYQRLFYTNPFARWYRNSTIITLSATLGTVVSATLVAYGFGRLRFAGRDMWFGLLLATMMVPGTVLIIPNFLVMKTLHWIDTYWPLILPYWLGGGAFNIFLLRQFFRTIPYELDEAAIVDGASTFRILWQLLVPNLKPVLAVVTVFSAIGHWNSFMPPLIYLNSIEKLPVAVGIRVVAASAATGPGQVAVMMAASTLLTVPVLVLFAAAQQYFMKGIVMTGLSGR